jgi:glycosyltransferase involved in cell wall biosynthesis
MASLSFSIVTPTLNAERYVAGCLASVSLQAWPGVEHIIVDGGSNDATEEVVRRYGATWLSRPGLRQAAAVNEGLRMSSGKLVGWLNADDLYTPGSLACVGELFEQHEQLDVIIGDCDLVDATGRPLRRLSPGPYDFERLLRKGNSVAQPAVFLRKRVFDQVGYLDESLEFAMDYDLWLRLRGLQVEYVPSVLAQFRWHPTSKTATGLDGNWSELRTIIGRYGGSWTPELAWSFVRSRFTLARQRLKGRLHRAI